MSELIILPAGKPPEDDDDPVPIPSASAPPHLPREDRERAARATFDTLLPLTTSLNVTIGLPNNKKQLLILHSLKSALASVPAAGLEACLE